MAVSRMRKKEIFPLCSSINHIKLKKNMKKILLLIQEQVLYVNMNIFEYLQECLGKEHFCQFFLMVYENSFDLFWVLISEQPVKFCGSQPHSEKLMVLLTQIKHSDNQQNQNAANVVKIKRVESEINHLDDNSIRVDLFPPYPSNFQVG